MSEANLKTGTFTTDFKVVPDFNGPEQTALFDKMRNDPKPGLAVKRVIERIDGGLSPATEMMLEEMTHSWETATARELQMAQTGYPFTPEGIHTPESLTYLSV